MNRLTSPLSHTSRLPVHAVGNWVIIFRYEDQELSLPPIKACGNDNNCANGTVYN